MGRVVVAVLAAFALTAPACDAGDDDGPTAGTGDGDALHVVATTSVLGDVVRNVVGDGARLDVLMEAGVDPHQFQPSAAQARALREADLVVANGLGLEAELGDVLASAEEEGVEVFRVTDHVDLIGFALAGGHVHDHAGDEDPHDEDQAGGDEHGHDEDHAGEDEHGHDDDDGDRAGTVDQDEETADGYREPDPHVWQDPLRMADAVRALGDRLDELDPDGDWTQRADAYAAELESVHADIEATFARIPDGRRKLLTSHDSLGYLADRYGFEVIGAIVPGGSTLGDPSGRQFQELASLVAEEDVPAVFAEVTQPTRLADALAREVGRDVEVVVIYTDALGEPGSGAETYTGMLTTNAERIADALAG